MVKNLNGRISLMLVVLMLFMSMPTSVFAATINDLKSESGMGNKITLENMSVKITNDNAEIGQEDVIDPTKDMTMRVDFIIPNDRTDIKAGDYLEVILPSYLDFSNLQKTEIKMKITGGSEVVLGNVTVSGSRAVLVFTDAVENEDYLERGGWFSAGLSFDEKKVETVEDKVVITILGNNFTILVKKPIDTGYFSLNKSGTADIANAEITWTVTATPSKMDKTYNGYVFIDTLPMNVSLIEDSFKISSCELIKDDLKFDKDKGTVEYAFGENVTGVQTITYKTRIIDIAKYNNKTITIINNANLSNADTTVSATATVKVTPQLILKSGAYNVTNHSVDWTIRVNSSKARLKDVVVTDVLTSDMTFVNLKIGNTVLTTDDKKPQYYTLDGQTVKIHLGNIDKRVDIKLNTKLDNTVKSTVQNKATITWNDEGSSISGGNIGTSDIGTGEINTNITSGFIAKSTDGNYNFKKNEMPWKITINKANKEIENATVVEVFAYNKDEVSAINNAPYKTLFGKYKNDTINYNHKYIEESLSIKGLVATKIDESTEFTIKGQYKVKTVQLSSSIEAQIVEVFLGTIDSIEEVSLKTKYTDKNAYGVNNKQTQYSMKNTAYLYYGDGNSKLYNSATEKHYRYILDKDCEEQYNYVDRTITWKLYLNHNSLDIEDGIITETLPKYWDVDGDDFYEIYKGGDVSLGNGNATIKKGEKLTADEVNALIKNVEITDNNDIKTIKLSFNSIGDKYVFLIKTKLSDDGADKQFNSNDAVNVTNTASMSGSSIIGNQGDYQTVTILNSLVSKSGALDKDSNGKYTGDATWTIDVNRNSINLPVDDLNKVYVIDKLNSYLEPKMNGNKYEIHMWEIELNSDGRLSLGSEVDQDTVQSGISYANKELRIKLPKTNGSYRIEMVTRITSDTVTEINNSASLEGVKTEIVSKNENVKIEYADGGAWANLAGKINLTKTADKTGSVLEGAVFGLYELSDDAKPVETLKYTKVTDKHGMIHFGRLKSGKYKLVEITAPIGYEIDKNSASRIIDLDTSTDDTRVVNLNITNKTLLRAVQILKTDELGKSLAGAEFTLYKNTIADKNVVVMAQSAVNGSVTFNNVAIGQYYIVETKAPTGYLAGTVGNVIKAVVDRDGNVSYFTGEKFMNLVTGIPTIKNIAYKGNIVISKVDKAGNPLKGAEFTLYDENKKAVGTAVSQGDNAIAKFENVRLGNYTIKETVAPSGYIASNEVINIVEKDFIKNNVILNLTVENEKRPSNPEDKPTEEIPEEETPLSPPINGGEGIDDDKIPLSPLTKPTKSPQTSDSTPNIMWSLILAAASAAVLLKKKPRKDMQ